jgi:hypothetical protein
MGVGSVQGEVARRAEVRTLSMSLSELFRAGVRVVLEAVVSVGEFCKRRR